MSQYREAKNTAIVGARGHGKSTEACNIVTNPDTGRKNGILYKTQMNLHDAAFKQFKAIDRLDQYGGGLAKIGSGSIAYPDFLKEITAHFHNGFVIVDDAKLFERHTLSKEAVDLLTMSRHHGLDVYYIYHSLKYTPIEMYEALDWIVLFYTNENIKSKLSSLPAGPVLLPAIERIDAQVKTGNKYYHEYIKLA